jgi:ribosomal protein S18 acetylase RimI-like enzyme
MNKRYISKFSVTIKQVAGDDKFYQATYITCLQINEAHHGEGWGSMLLQNICKDPNRTYVLLSEVAMSDSEQLSVCIRRKMFYLKNGFRTAPV